MGAFVGGFLLVALIALILERFAFKGDEPDTRALKTAGVAFAIAAVAAFFAIGPLGPLFYLPGALVVYLWQRHTFRKAWSED